MSLDLSQCKKLLYTLIAYEHFVRPLWDMGVYNKSDTVFCWLQLNFYFITTIFLFMKSS